MVTLTHYRLAHWRKRARAQNKHYKKYIQTHTHTHKHTYTHTLQKEGNYGKERKGKNNQQTNFLKYFYGCWCCISANDLENNGIYSLLHEILFKSFMYTHVVLWIPCWQFHPRILLAATKVENPMRLQMIPYVLLKDWSTVVWRVFMPANQNEKVTDTLPCNMVPGFVPVDIA